MQSILEIPAAAASGREARATIRAPWIIPPKKPEYPARLRNVPLTRTACAMQSISESPAAVPVSAGIRSALHSGVSVSRR